MNALGAIGVIVGLIVVIVLALETPPVVAILGGVGFVAGVLALGWWGARMTKVFAVKRIDQNIIWLKGAHPDYLLGLRQLEHGHDMMDAKHPVGYDGPH